MQAAAPFTTETRHSRGRGEISCTTEGQARGWEASLGISPWGSSGLASALPCFIARDSHFLGACRLAVAKANSDKGLARGRLIA